MKWLIDKLMIDKGYGNNIYDSLLNTKRDVSIIEYSPFYNPKIEDCQHLIYGSLQIVNQLRDNHNVASFGPTKKFDFNYYSSLLKNHFFMSNDYIIATASWLNDPLKIKQLYQIFGDKIFIRPNTGFKMFSGQVVDISDENEVRRFYKQSGASSNTIVIISSAFKILQEYRFFVSKEKGVLTGSTYSATERFNESKHYSQKSFDFANLVMNNLEDTIDDIIVIDVADYLDKEGNKKIGLVEINCASCSGLYACDALPIIEEMERVIKKENEMF